MKLEEGSPAKIAKLKEMQGHAIEHGWPYHINMLGEKIRDEQAKLFNMEGFGCYAWRDRTHGTLLSFATMADGSADDQVCEITAPEPEFVLAVNAVMGTDYKFEEFAGR